MTQFANKSFSVAVGSEEYRDNFGRTFRGQLRAVLIGQGRWAEKIRETLREMRVEVVAQAGKHYWKDALRVSADFVVIACAAASHAEVAKEALFRQKSVFLEKPMALTLHDARELERIWLQVGQPPFLVDHTHLFNPEFERAVREMRALGEHCTIHIGECGPGPFRLGCPPLWDWGPHAIAVALALSGLTAATLLSCEAVNHRETSLGLEEEVTIQLSLHGGSLAVLDVGNARGEKVRAIHATCGGMLVQADLKTPHQGEGAPLFRALKAFTGAVVSGENPLGDIRFGMHLPVEVVRILEEVDINLGAQGVPRPKLEPSLKY